ncbi:IS3 family transposase [Nonomuraea fuscirosea]|uniref:IS3 family transposase n=1 Tax=Nonomuraea fuscirosea TaxID=1291556 RepID=UPI002DDC1C6A|nr:IS3 family transposase [Nonomuraea fuscirosea]WSA50837.1 IS3 family transposase [Nonomuraea fuscirosea]WSA51063.1 IS3 family transposase [Nonomuraea fuscirosea]WSA53689.1 IS3 family transposase [Nonomuraea fuscirosea]
MARRRRQFSPEFKEEAVRMVLEGERTVASVAREFDINASTLGSWVNRHRIVSAQDEQPPVSGPERARIRELERENAELREKLIFLKKSRLLRGRNSMTLAKYELIDAEKASHKIARMCAWLGVSRSGYYEWRERPASATAQRRTLLSTLVAEIFAGSHETYGYRRVHAALARRGEHCSAELVRTLMREQGLVPAQVRAFRPATTIQGDYRGIPDLVGRDFTAERPGVKLVGDVTYVRTWEGFLYLATVIDCHSKAVLGWAMADHYRTELVTDAIRMAAGTGLLQSGAVFHSDRGSNYTSDEFGRFLTGQGIRRSVGRTGVCWDNAMAESFFSAIKNEWLHRFVFTTRAKARRQVIRYIEGFYNHRRLHSALGYRPPLEVLNESLSQQAAA